MDNLSIASALQLGTKQLASTSDTADLDAQLLLLEVIGKARSYLFTWPEKLLSEEQSARFLALLARREKGEPIAYILGYQDFWTLRLKVSDATLIPRADTELLVEQALKLFDQQRIRVADLGCGTGAVGLAIASERPNWKITGCDYIEQAARLAEQNRQALSINNIEFVCGSWFEPLSARYDLIVSNPPYIEEHDRHLSLGDVRFEPLSALVSSNSGLKDIQHIIMTAPLYLIDQGWLLLEHGYDQGLRVRELFEASGFAKIQTFQDLNGNDRVTLAQWCIGADV
jgi:release factor glutamine methyltransferase